MHENIYHQRQHKLIEAKLYDSWQRDLEAFLTKQRFAPAKEPWSRLRDFYHPDFSAHVDDILLRMEKVGRGDTPVPYP